MTTQSNTENTGDDMRAITDQIEDIQAGRMTPDQVAAEGVSEYAIDYYAPQTVDDMITLTAIREAVAANPAPKADAPAPAPACLKECSCGHESAHPMNTPRGSACPECYDSMSE